MTTWRKLHSPFRRHQTFHCHKHDRQLRPRHEPGLGSTKMQAPNPTLPCSSSAPPSCTLSMRSHSLVASTACLMLALQRGGTKYQWNNSRVISLSVIMSIGTAVFVSGANQTAGLCIPASLNIDTKNSIGMLLVRIQCRVVGCYPDILRQ